MSKSAKPFIVPIGGFLGAGKTSLILAASRVLHSRNLKCAAILNDQGGHLVDTEHVRRHQMPATEVEGGCFCCRFSDLIERAEELQKFEPSVIFIESVGSCTDLSATVLQPLKRDFRDRFQVAPLTVAIDPKRAPHFLALPADVALGYLYRQQIAEADLVVFTKSDLTRDFPPNLAAEPRYLSSATGEGVSEWLDEVLSGLTPAGAKLLDIDYDRYAEAEAALGWLNWHAQIRLERPLSPASLIGPFVDNLVAAIAAEGGEIMHLKVLDETSSGYLKVSVTSNHAESKAEGDLTASPELKHELRLNLRALLTAERLQRIFVRELLRLPGTHEFPTLECFSPARPNPEFRFSEIVPDQSSPLTA